MTAKRRRGFTLIELLVVIAAERGQMRAALDDFPGALRLDPSLKSLVDPQVQKVHKNFAGCLDRRN